MCYDVGGCNVVAMLGMAVMLCLECRNCGVHELGLHVWYVGVIISYVCCDILLLLIMANMDRILCRRLWSEQCRVQHI